MKTPLSGGLTNGQPSTTPSGSKGKDEDKGFSSAALSLSKGKDKVKGFDSPVLLGLTKDYIVMIEQTTALISTPYTS